MGCNPQETSVDGTQPPTGENPVTLQHTTEGSGTAEVNSELPQAVEYELGEATITQERFPEDSRFRNMPVRLNGMIAVPVDGAGPFPVVVILHGNHPGCPIPEGDDVDRWPCAPEDERPNYRGFEYLVRQLAADGYVALSLNINAENTLGFGEPIAGERLEQLVDLHLDALAKASAGGENGFGVELDGRADLTRLALFGHSRGGGAAYELAHHPDVVSGIDYGPVDGVLLIAPAVNSETFTNGADMPMAVILPACDGDLSEQEGQHFIEATRLAPGQTEWATSVWLEQANHNYFNQTLPDDVMGRIDRPDCETILEPKIQQNWLSEYAVDFMSVLFSQDQALQRDAKTRMGLDAGSPAVDSLYSLPALVTSLVSAVDRQRLFVPANAGELNTNLAGKAVIAEGVTTHFCPEGFYTPTMLPGSEPCRRMNVTVPGQPALAIISWSESGGKLRFTMPESTNLSEYASISLRAAIDPLSELNPTGSTQSFTIQLKDADGNTAARQTRPDEATLRFPPGIIQQEEFLPDGVFTGRVPLTTIRLPLGGFTGVDLTVISEITLLFNRTPSGTLFFSDLELVR